jgi:tetratricopeptide (TPR) repeat protein
MVRSSTAARAAVVVLAFAAGALSAASSASAREATPIPSLSSSTVFEPANTLEGNYLAAYIAGASRDTAGAAAFYREALKADPKNPELLERAFLALLSDGAMSEAFRAADRLATRDASNGLANLALGIRQLKAKQYSGARAQLAKGGRGPGNDLTTTLLTAWSFAGAGDGKKALESVDKLRNDGFYKVFRDYHAGLIADVTGDGAEAERRLKLAYEAERNTLRVVDAYARNQARRGHPEVALAAYSEFEKVVPRHPVVREAIDRLNANKPLGPIITTAQEGAAEVLYGLGAAGNSQGEELPAIVYLRLALHLDADHTFALSTLGEIFDRLKLYERANEVFNRIPASSPLRANADIQVGLNLEQLKKEDEAVRHLEAIIKQRPNDIEAISALGTVLRSRKRYAEAAEVYSRAIALIPQPGQGDWTLFYFRGSAYERAKDWAKAEADLKKALELVPDSPPAGKALVMNYLAYSWVDNGNNIDEAFRMLKQAVEMSPRDGMIIDSLGWAYFRLGRYDDAVRELEKAVDAKPGDPVINDHLGDAYWRVGRRVEAKFQWQHAKDSEPEPEDLQKIVQKLENGLPDDKPNVTSELKNGG